MPSLKRRDVLKIGAGALLTAGTWPRLSLAQEKEAWTFIAVNDLHFQDEKCVPWFEKAVAAMKNSAHAAEFCLIGGDLANKGKREQILGIKTAFAALKMPLYAVPGNHDYLADDDRKAYDELFPGHLNQIFEHRGWQFIGLDTTQGTIYEKTKIQQPTFDWLNANLPQLDKTKPTIIWTHFPLGKGVTYRPQNADDLLAKFADFNLRAAFCGHWHGFSEKTWHDAVFTTDRCCSRVRNNSDGSPKKGWFVCTVENGNLSRRFVELDLAD